MAGFAFRIAKTGIIVFTRATTFRRYTHAAPMGSLLDDMRVFPAGGAVIVRAGLTFAPADRSYTFIAGFAIGIA
jgi:hypothetical protein